MFCVTLHATARRSHVTCAGAAVLVRQYFADGWYPSGTPTADDGFAPSAALLKAMLVHGTKPMNGWFMARPALASVPAGTLAPTSSTV